MAEKAAEEKALAEKAAEEKALAEKAPEEKALAEKAESDQALSGKIAGEEIFPEKSSSEAQETPAKVHEKTPEDTDKDLKEDVVVTKETEKPIKIKERWSKMRLVLL